MNYVLPQKECKFKIYIDKFWRAESAHYLISDDINELTLIWGQKRQICLVTRADKLMFFRPIYY